MYTPSRSGAYYEPPPNSDNLRKLQSYDTDNKPMMPYQVYFDGYPQIYASHVNLNYTQNYIPSDYEESSDFPSLSNSKPPGFTREEFYPPPGFSKPLKTKAPNPNAVSFIPSYLAAPPMKDEKEEIELKEYGIRGMLTIQKNLQDDKSLLAKGIDLNSFELNKKELERIAPQFNLAGKKASEREENEYFVPQSYYMSRPILKAKMVKIYEVETLFYAFYNMPGELIQAYVAQELYSREWLYNPSLKQWFINISAGEWKTFDVAKFKILVTTPNQGPFLTKEDVAVKQR